MTSSLLGVLLIVCVAFLGLALARVLGARRRTVGLDWIVAGAGLAATGLWMRLWPLVLAGAAAAAWGFWKRANTSREAGDARVRAAAALLGVSVNAGPDQIKAAFRQAMGKAHPDAGGDAARARALVAARDLLLRRRSRI